MLIIKLMFYWRCFVLDLWVNKTKAIKVWQLALKMLAYAFIMYF